MKHSSTHRTDMELPAQVGGKRKRTMHLIYFALWSRGMVATVYTSWMLFPGNRTVAATANELNMLWMHGKVQPVGWFELFLLIKKNIINTVSLKINQTILQFQVWVAWFLDYLTQSKPCYNYNNKQRVSRFLLQLLPECHKTVGEPRLHQFPTFTLDVAMTRLARPSNQGGCLSTFFRWGSPHLSTRFQLRFGAPCLGGWSRSTRARGWTLVKSIQNTCYE